jgi:hypothetical protein
MTQRIQDFILNMWRFERMSNEWHKSITCPIYKKGEKSECSNYRVNLATVINNRLTTYAEDLLSQEQNGFRKQVNYGQHIYNATDIREMF